MGLRRSGADILGAMASLPLSADQALVVTGSLQAKVEDRSHQRNEIAPVSIVTTSGVAPVNFFQDKGELGVSSFVFWDAETVYYSTGLDLFRLQLSTGVQESIEVANLIDVHEMTRVGDLLWLSNTGSDELIAVHPTDGNRVERTPLAPFRPNHNPSDQSIDRFHTNQVFEGPDNSLFALVHHASGRQLLKRIRSRLLKSHGDGGVIDLVNRESIELALTAPHSATRVGDGWWICDSGKAELGVFSHSWDRVATIPTSGWGRGASLSADGTVLFVGLSPIRTRYRSTISTPQVTEAAVEAFDVASRSALAVETIPNIEQVNNVYLVPSTTAKRLTEL